MPRSDSSTVKPLIIGLSLALVVVLGMGILAVAGSRLLLNEKYPQRTPEDVLNSARAMVVNGDAHRLPDLIYADDKRMRRLLNEFGRLLGSLQELGVVVARAFPEEIEQIRAEAEAAALRGEASGAIQKLMSQQPLMAGRGRNQRRGGGGAGGFNPEAQQQAFNNAMRELFSDPYGWLERSEGKLSVQTVTDDTAALLWDGKPVFGVGLMLRQDGDKWYVSLPTGAPGINRIVPKSDEAWEIMGSLVAVFDNAIKDLTRDVRTGRTAKLDELARKAGEKAFIPAVITFLAYGKAMEAERKEQRARAAGTTSGG
jgi:hypothetical protein